MRRVIGENHASCKATIQMCVRVDKSGNGEFSCSINSFNVGRKFKVCCLCLIENLLDPASINQD